MRKIEIEIYEQIKGEPPGHTRKAGNRRVSEVFSDIIHYLTEKDLMPDDYLLLDSDFKKRKEFRNMLTLYVMPSMAVQKALIWMFIAG